MAIDISFSLLAIDTLPHCAITGRFHFTLYRPLFGIDYCITFHYFHIDAPLAEASCHRLAMTATDSFQLSFH
jgi:hypothetical protein